MYIASQCAHRFVRIGILGLLVQLLVACGGTSTGGSTSSTGGTSNATPTQAGASQKPASPAGQINEFQPSNHGSTFGGITKGPDGNLWFTRHETNTVGYITPAGTYKEFPIFHPGNPSGITKGPDGNLWFTVQNEGANIGNAGQIGRITPTGTVTMFTLSTPNSDTNGITAGPDGNLWFGDDFTGMVGNITSGK